MWAEEERSVVSEALRWVLEGRSGTPPSDPAVRYRARERGTGGVLRSSEPALTVDRAHLIGYLGRRYGYTGGYMQIEAAGETSHSHTLAHSLWNFSAVELWTLDELDSSVPTAGAASEHGNAKRGSFDVILIDAIVEASRLIPVVEKALLYLSSQGTMLIANTGTHLAAESLLRDKSADASAPLPLISIHLRTMSHVDCVLGDFDR